MAKTEKGHGNGVNIWPVNRTKNRQEWFI